MHSMRVVLLSCSIALISCTGVVGEMPADEVDTDGGTTTPDAGPNTAEDAGTDADAGPTLEEDAGTATDAGIPDAGPTGRVPVFVLVGKQGRRAISCDDGRTWKNDVSFDDAWPTEEQYRCWQGDYMLSDGGTQHTDCDHNAYSSTSLSFSNDAFFQTTGWGAPGTFYKTANGTNWVSSPAITTADLMSGSGVMLTASRYPLRSVDQGATWTQGTEIPVESNGNTIWNIRGGVFGGSGSGVFLVLAQDGANFDMQASDDTGLTWRRPTLANGDRADVCGAGHPVSGNGVIVTLRTVNKPNNGGSIVTVCRSDDNAHTFTTHQLGEDVWPESKLLWSGTEFIVWSGGHVHRSPDGRTWTTAETKTRSSTGAMSGGPNPGAVAVGPTGTFIGVKGGWQVWYEQQRFYRSTDGVIWDELAEGTYRQGHPVTAMISGTIERGGVCP